MSTNTDPFHIPHMRPADIYDRILLQAYNGTLETGFCTYDSLLTAAFDGWKGDAFNHLFPEFIDHLVKEGLINKEQNGIIYKITVDGIKFVEETKWPHRKSPYRYHLSIRIFENRMKKYGFPLGLLTIFLSIVAIIISIIALKKGTL